MHVHSIVLLPQREQLTYSPENKLQIKMVTASYLGVLCRVFRVVFFYENLIKNIDETYFFMNLDNGQMLGFRGDTSVKYVEVVCDRDSMTMVIRIYGRR